MILILIALIVVLACGLLVAWPQTERGVVTEVGRPFAVIIGGAAPIVARWATPSAVLDAVLIGIAFLLGTCAVLLLATGWQTTFRGRQAESDEPLDPTMFDPTSLWDTSSAPLSRHDDFGGCLLAIIFAVGGALVIAGLFLTRGIKRLLPDPRTPMRRTMRILLSFGYGLALFASAVVVMSSLRDTGKEISDQPAKPLSALPTAQIVLSTTD